MQKQDSYLLPFSESKIEPFLQKLAKNQPEISQKSLFWSRSNRPQLKSYILILTVEKRNSYLLPFSESKIEPFLQKLAKNQPEISQKNHYFGVGVTDLN